MDSDVQFERSDEDDHGEFAHEENDFATESVKYTEPKASADVSTGSLQSLEADRESPRSSYSLGGSSQRVPAWGQNDSCRVSGWGQIPSETSHRSSGVPSGWGPRCAPFLEPPKDEYSGPLETWPNYRAVSSDEWDTFKRHQVVYTDGSNVPGEEPGWLYCRLCSKKCASKDLMQLHIDSAKHQRQIAWYATEAAFDSEIRTPTEESDIFLTQKDKDMLEANRCVVEDGWIVCTLCQKKLMDMSFVPDHIASRKHRSNIEWANSVDGRFIADTEDPLPSGIVARDNDYYCTICHASMTSKSVMEVHVSGTRHSRNSANTGIYGTDPFEGFDIPIRQGIALSQLVSTMKDPEYLNSLLRNKQKPPVYESSRMQSRSSVDPVSPPPRAAAAVVRSPSPPRTLPPPLSQFNQQWNRPQSTNARFDPPNLIDI